MIRVLLADDETLVRRGIRSLLGLVDDISVVAEATDGEEAVRLIQTTRPDAVLLDVRMPKCSGVEVLKRLRTGGWFPAVILLTTFDDDNALFRGIRAGAKGFLLKDISLERLAEGIRLVAAGETLIRPGITERVLKAMETAGLQIEGLNPPDRLTKREIEVLRMMAGGYSNREIGEALGTTEGTIKTHISSILSKMGVRDRIRAVLKGIERGDI
jgi:DNA-binding NarL/FixJ family response regulator